MKLYLYPNIIPHIQDLYTPYRNSTPLSEEGIRKHCAVVSDPKQANFYYMGQISDRDKDGQFWEKTQQKFKMLEEDIDKHLFDLDGAFMERFAPDWMTELTKTGNCSKNNHYLNPNYCLRPPTTALLVYLGKENPSADIEYPDHKTFSFMGIKDPYGVREKMLKAVDKLKLPGEYALTSKIHSHELPTSRPSSEYIKVLYENLISLCPTGIEHDTARFYEACFFGRVPVCIGNVKFVTDDSYKVDFPFKIPPEISVDQLAKELGKIYDTPISELIERGKAARNYFQQVIVKYYSDPTLFFLEFLKRRGLFSS